MLDVRDGYVKRDSQGRYMVGSEWKYRDMKEMQQKENSVVNLVTLVAKALEMAKSERERKREDSVMGRRRNTATMDWNPLRY